MTTVIRFRRLAVEGPTATLPKVRRGWSTTRVGWAAALLLLTATHVIADPIVVNCDQGQSLNQTIARLDEFPATVLVQGTCTEYVTIKGLAGLTLKGLPGATLQQPTTNPGLLIHVLSIAASRSITIDGFAIHSGASALGGIRIGQNSIDVRLRNMTIDGAAAFGIEIYEGSQVSLARVTARDPGFATVAALDVSDVHIEQCVFEHLSGTSSWNEGLFAGSGHVTMQNTAIRNMQVGIDVANHGSVDIQSFNTYYPVSASRDVVIDSPAGTNFLGAKVASGSALNLDDTKLRITNSGQPWGGNTAGVWVSDGSTLSDSGGNLVVSGSHGQGVFVSNNSHASLTRSSITGSNHGGLVVANLSTIAVGTGTNSFTQVSGNGTDLFCDSKSVITGGSAIAGASTVNCGNLVPGDSEPIP